MRAFCGTMQTDRRLRALRRASQGATIQAQAHWLHQSRPAIDSNLVENDVRPSAVGKRRWLFVGHPDAGWRSAVIYTIIQSCRRYGINPQEYLTDVLARLPSMTNSQVGQLLHHVWMASQLRATQAQ